MGAIADGERGDALGPCQRRGEGDGAADRLATRWNASVRASATGEQIVDQQIE